MEVKKPFSNKQLYAIHEANKRLNIWQGSVRSGKTFSSIWRLIQDLKYMPQGDAVICGVSRETIGRNVLSEMSLMLGIPIPGAGRNVMELFGRTIHLVGATDERAERKIRGATFMIAYVDEVTLIPESFFKMLLSRLSLANAKLLGTTNTDAPRHWLKREYLDNPDLDLADFHFNLDDNPILTEEYKSNLKKEYQGVWYKRFIEGDWVLADGLIYSIFNQDHHVINMPPSHAEFYTVGVDFGINHPTCFSMVGYNSNAYPNMWLEKEYGHSAKDGYGKTCDELAEDLKLFIKDHNVKGIYVDPSAAAFIQSCRKLGVRPLLECKNDVLSGINHVSNLLVNGTFKVCANCTGTINEFYSYSWDKKADVLGIDRPQKINDDYLDALRYSLVSYNPSREGEEKITKEKLNEMWHKRNGGGSTDIFNNPFATKINPAPIGFRR